MGINVTSCGQGHARWSRDDKCYKLYSQGPCDDPDQVYLPSSSLPSFAECQSFENHENEVSFSPSTTTTTLSMSESVTSSENVTKCEDKHGWYLPSRVKLLSNQEKNCLSQEKVFWPPDSKCYSLLTKGPCAEDEWLVTRDSCVTCLPRTCPCDPLTRPELCEVQLRHVTCNHGCVVAAAAVQDGHCRPGEQLLVSPAGYGECGCVSDPPHLRWPRDGRCYQVNTRGPCSEGKIKRQYS